MLSIKRTDYAPIFKSAIIAKSQDNLNVLMNIPFFSKFNKILIYRFASSMLEESFHRNQQVYNENDMANKVYIVKEGNFIVNSSR